MFTDRHWPNIGRYIGIVDDEMPIYFITQKDNIFDYYDKYSYQRRRVYADELKAMSDAYSKENLNEAIKSMEEFLK